MAGRVWSTTDIALAAFVAMRGEGDGIALAKVDRNGSSSTFVFKDEKDRIDGLIVQWPSTECFKFDSVVRALKSLGYSKSAR
jgi:hypothetical protein